MAKKTSARSKGYRTYKKVEKGFTETEKKTMIIGFAVIVVIILAVVLVPDLIESRHLLKVKDGVVQDAGDNWLISNMSETSKPKYRKIAEVNPADGWELAETEDGLSGDDQERMFYFAPAEGTEAVVDEYYVLVGKDNYDSLANTAIGTLSNFAYEMINQSEVQSEVIGENSVSYFTMEYSLNASEDEENPVLEYYQTVNMYVKSNVDGRCVLVSANTAPADKADFVDSAALVDLCKAAVANIVIG